MPISSLSRLFPLLTMAFAVFFLVQPIEAMAQGKGRGKPPPDPPPPDSPPARFWHAFDSNGAESAEASRLYLFGGSDGQALADFWYYSVAERSWSVAPTGKSKPVKRQLHGFSCGDGQCVISNGSAGGSWLKETSIYDVASATWSKLNCNGRLCPSARVMPAMAHDPSRGYHLLFGGFGAGTSLSNLSDTYTIAGGSWTQHNPAGSPSARGGAAAVFVPASLNRIVLFGGQVLNVGALCDMWSWTGTTWQQINMNNVGPCLHSHSMAWDENKLIVAGGFVDVNDTPSNRAWYFSFDSATSGSWSEHPDTAGCYASVPPAAQMAYDEPTNMKVFFGGATNSPGGVILHDDTVLCE